MNAITKVAAAALLISAPTFAAADALAVSLGATFDTNAAQQTIQAGSGTIGGSSAGPLTANPSSASGINLQLVELESLSLAAASATDGMGQMGSTNNAGAASNAQHNAFDASSTSASAVASNKDVRNGSGVDVAIVATPSITDSERSEGTLGATGNADFVSQGVYTTTLTLNN